MTREEAIELVLGGGAWVPCATCGAGGYVNPPDPSKRLVKCGVCEAAGYLRSPALAEAYVLLELPFPDKPITSVERLGGPNRYRLVNSASGYIRERMAERSLTRQLLPPQMIQGPPKKP